MMRGLLSFSNTELKVILSPCSYEETEKQIISPTVNANSVTVKSTSHLLAGFNQINCQDAVNLALPAERTHPLGGRPALQFHLLQVGGSKGHVVVNEVRDQRRGPVVF